MSNTSEGIMKMGQHLSMSKSRVSAFDSLCHVYTATLSHTTYYKLHTSKGK